MAGNVSQSAEYRSSCMHSEDLSKHTLCCINFRCLIENMFLIWWCVSPLLKINVENERKLTSHFDLWSYQANQQSPFSRVQLWWTALSVLVVTSKAIEGYDFFSYPTFPCNIMPKFQKSRHIFFQRHLKLI